jgi:heme oxygenase
VSLTLPAEDDADAPFSATLRERTWAWHQQAEDSGFLRSVIAGAADRSACIAMAVQHYLVYRALDAHVERWIDDPLVAPFAAHDGLRRTPRLAVDLAELLGPRWESELAVLSATRAYVERIEQAADQSWTLVAHHYTRYLGDLSGGIAIGRGFARIVGCAVGEPGASFYAFDSVPDPDAFKRMYRRNLDASAWTSDQRAGFLDEVIAAYALNSAVYQALAAAGAGATAPS